MVLCPILWVRSLNDIVTWVSLISYLDECITELWGCYVDLQESEMFCRTIVDLIFLDRLRVLKDENARNHLNMVPEVPLFVEREGVTISGKADWCLGHGNIKRGFESALIVMYVFPHLIPTG